MDLGVGAVESAESVVPLRNEEESVYKLECEDLKVSGVLLRWRVDDSNGPALTILDVEGGWQSILQQH